MHNPSETHMAFVGVKVTGKKNEEAVGKTNEAIVEMMVLAVKPNSLNDGHSFWLVPPEDVVPVFPRQKSTNYTNDWTCHQLVAGSVANGNLVYMRDRTTRRSKRSMSITGLPDGSSKRTREKSDDEKADAGNPGLQSPPSAKTDFQNQESNAENLLRRSARAAMLASAKKHETELQAIKLQISATAKETEKAKSMSAKKRKQVAELRSEITQLNSTISNAKKIKIRRLEHVKDGEERACEEPSAMNLDVNELSAKLGTVLSESLLTATTDIDKTMNNFSNALEGSLDGIAQHTKKLKNQPDIPAIPALITKSLGDIPKHLKVIKSIPQLFVDASSEEEKRSERIIRELQNIKAEQDTIQAEQASTYAKRAEADKINIAENLRKLKKAQKGLKNVASLMQKKLDDQTSQLITDRITAIDLSFSARLKSQDEARQRADAALIREWQTYARQKQEQEHKDAIDRFQSTLNSVVAGQQAGPVVYNPNVLASQPSFVAPSPAYSAPNHAANASSHAPDALSARNENVQPWETWNKRQISDWMVSEGCAALEQLLYPQGSREAAGPLGIVHGRQLAHLDEEVLKSVGDATDSTLVIAKRTFLAAFRLLTSARR